jgi:flavin-binding protein dodecin
MHGVYYACLNERLLVASLTTPERKESTMAESVYKVITLVGTSNESWEKAAVAAIEQASHTLREIRVARIVEQDVHIEPGKLLTYRVKMELSFKYEGGE